MNATTLKAILIEELGAEEKGGAVNVTAESKVTIIARYGHELVPMSKVRTLRITDAFVNIVGETGQFFVDTESEFMIKAGDSRNGQDVRPGFH